MLGRSMGTAQYVRPTRFIACLRTGEIPWHSNPTSCVIYSSSSHYPRVSRPHCNGNPRLVLKSFWEKKKGCDIGYAPVASSCEGADAVDTCTVTALDVITAFAVPNPNCSSQNQSVFSGLVALQVTLPSRSPSLLRTGWFYLANPFSRRREQH